VPLKSLLPWSHFVAASTFLLSLFEKRKNDSVDFFAYFRGVACAAVPMTLIGTLLGLAMQSALPPLLIFSTSLFFPVYFTILLVSDIKKKLETAAVSIAFILTPIVELYLPGWGVTVAALSAATAVSGIRLWMQRTV